MLRFSQLLKNQCTSAIPEPEHRLQQGKDFIPQLKNIHFKSPHFRYLKILRTSARRKSPP